MMIEENDWRLRGQEEYMKDLKFKYISFTAKKGGSLHAHCEFCWHKFMEYHENFEESSNEGYCSIDEKYWVCNECFEDFKDVFSWSCIKI